MRVDHMQQQIRVARLFERSPKSLDQLVWQVTNEAHGIGQDNRPDIVELKPAQGRIKCRKQLIGCVDLGLGQGIEQGRFTGVGIANQRNRRDICALTPTASLLALAADLFQA
ncbi:hypothetical protein D3C81_1800580 [compost metagenome]